MSRCRSEKRRHVQRQIGDAVFCRDVVRVKDIGRVDVCPVLAPEFIERNRCVGSPAFDFDWRYVLPSADLRLRDEKVDFHPFVGFVLVVPREEIKCPSGRRQHLRDHVLDKHPLVQLYLVEQKPPVDVGHRILVLAECEADEKPGVAHVAFERRPVEIEPQPHVRLGGVVAGIDDHRILEPEQRVFVLAQLGVLGYVGGLELLFVPGKRGRQCVKHGFNLVSKGSGMFVYAVPVQGQDAAFDPVHGHEVSFCLDKAHDGLRHPADDDVLPEKVHHHFVNQWAEGLPLVEKFAYRRPARFVARRPKELLKIHRVHLDVGFFGRDENVLDVLPDGNKGTRFDVMESSVCDKVLDSLPGSREVLHFVKDDDAVVFHEPDVGIGLQKPEERIKIVEIVVEKASYLWAGLGEVNQEIGLVLVLGERFGDPAFADAPSAVNQDGAVVGFLSLPFQERIVNLAFHGSSPMFYGAYYTPFRDIEQVGITPFRDIENRKITPFREIERVDGIREPVDFLIKTTNIYRLSVI